MLNVKTLRLINFRNYKDLFLDLNDNINIFIGKNAQGKTNLLEAVYMCATGHSFRTNRDKELISFNKKEAYVGSKVKIGENQKLIEIKLDKEGPKRIKINKLELSKQKELDSGLKIVVFSPDDLALIKGSPKERRFFIDMSISQIRPIYKYNINRYNKILSQRNSLLKSDKSKNDIINLLEIFDIQLVKAGTEIIFSRIEFINKLSKIASTIHHKLTLGKEYLTLNYYSNINYDEATKKEIEKKLLQNIIKNRNKDIILGSTSIGPHRDDIKININNLDSRIFASQGQQRTTVLSIKLSEVEIIKMERDTYPVLLLDDVFSELDYDRRRYLINSFKNTQTLITSTDIANLNEFVDLNKSIYYIENGNIKSEE